jgi:CRP-like cAMP-binding protein
MQKEEPSLTQTFVMFKNVKTFSDADSLGEINLVTVNKGNFANFQCTEDTVLLSLHRDGYQKIIDRAVRRDMQVRVDLFREFRILKNCTASNLEELLEHTKLLTLRRGTVLFKVGDIQDGVYLIKEGWFEVTKPAKITSEDWLDQMNIDPIAKIQLKKKSHVQADSFMKTIKMSVLGKGQVFGIEEIRDKLQRRTTTVTCVENNSKVIFIPHQAFLEIVMTDGNAEIDIKSESVIKDAFFKSRAIEQQRTIWKNMPESILRKPLDHQAYPKLNDVKTYVE